METSPVGFAFPVIFLAFMIIGIALTVFWIWALVDCVTKETDAGNNKLIWILVIVLVGWIGALIYLLARRPQRIAELGR